MEHKGQGLWVVIKLAMEHEGACWFCSRLGFKEGEVCHFTMKKERACHQFRICNKNGRISLLLAVALSIVDICYRWELELWLRQCCKAPRCLYWRFSWDSSTVWCNLNMQIHQSPSKQGISPLQLQRIFSLISEWHWRAQWGAWTDSDFIPILHV